jgi:uncharacterized damage-inducible protein DinB
METLKFIEQSLNESDERLVKSFLGLSPDELVWRPALHANSIAEIAYHVARVEDRMTSRIGGETALWESQKWYLRFDYPQDQPMATDFQILRDLGLGPPKMDDLQAYIGALHQNTLDKLHSLSSEDLDHAHNPSNPDRTVALSFRHLIVHTNHHHGQLDFVRGLMQPDWGLPTGTGMVQP